MCARARRRTLGPGYWLVKELVGEGSWQDMSGWLSCKAVSDFSACCLPGENRFSPRWSESHLQPYRTPPPKTGQLIAIKEGREGSREKHRHQLVGWRVVVRDLAQYKTGISPIYHSSGCPQTLWWYFSNPHNRSVSRKERLEIFCGQTTEEKHNPAFRYVLKLRH